MQLRLLSMCTIAATFGLASTSFADNIQFDPDGAGGAAPVTVASFDFLPGNSLSQGAGLADAVSPASYTQYAQGRLGSLLDPNNNVISTPGLNSTYEITVMAEYGGTALELVPGLIQLGIDPAQQVNFVRLYHDTNVNADALAGTGYADGTMILEAAVIEANGLFSVINTTPTDFDQFGSNDYPGQSSVLGQGTLRLDTEVVSVDSSFFLDGASLLTMLLNTNSITPFSEVDPSAVFDDGSVVPNLGAVNGLGEDIQLQTDATASFVIPEPATAALLGLGGLLMFRRRK